MPSSENTQLVPCIDEKGEILWIETEGLNRLDFRRRDIGKKITCQAD